MQNKLETIKNIFDGKEIRSVWDKNKEEYYFSVTDVISALTNATIPKRYWTDLKRQLVKEGSELYEKIVQLKIKSNKDGKSYLTDTLNTEGIFRLIESVPSPKAEPFKLWLAKLGRERIDEAFDPEILINRAINYYRRRGYNDLWIEKRLKCIINRHKLTDIWKEGGIKKPSEYAILTNEIYKEWSGMNANEYKAYKGLRKESLRDNMNDIEVSLTDLSETVARELTKAYRPCGLEENRIYAKSGGEIANITKVEIEKRLGKKVVTKENMLNYEYVNNNLKLK